MKSKDARAHSAELDFKPYKHQGNAGVVRYAMLEDGIVLTFANSNDYYLYSFAKPGKKHVEQMKQAAKNGERLSTYVSQQVRQNYADKWDPLS